MLPTYRVYGVIAEIEKKRFCAFRTGKKAPTAFHVYSYQLIACSVAGACNRPLSAMLAVGFCLRCQDLY
jgi:hypothetical protein